MSGGSGSAARSFEDLKARAGNPYGVIDAIKRAATDGIAAMSDDDLQLCRWYGLYPHRNERDYFMLRLKLPGGALHPKTIGLFAWSALGLSWPGPPPLTVPADE